MEILKVVAGIYIKDGLCLTSVRNDDQSHAGCYEFPGGKVESCETKAQALMREWREELAVAFGSARDLITVQHDYTNYSVNVSFMQVFDVVGEPVGAEGQTIVWQPIQELHVLKWMPANLRAVEYLQKNF